MEALTNKQYKEIKALIERSGARKKSGLFTGEGERFFNEIPQELIETVVVSESYGKAHSMVGACVLKDEDYRRLCDTKHPQGIMAVIRKPEYKMPELLEAAEEAEDGIYLILEGISDPGNLGTIIRTAEAAGVRAVFIGAGSADIYSPKTVRSTMGSIFRVPFIYTDDLAPAVKALQERSVTVYAAHLSGKPLNEAKLTPKRAFMIGNEANGLSDELSVLSDRKIKIPMHGRVESLNAAIAAAVLMYHESFYHL